jgi:Spy/CpxP family protein refolding chaperone
MPIVLGLIGGAIAFKVIRRMRHGGWRGHHRHGRRFGGPGRLFWIARELDLDRAQKKVVFDSIADVKRAASDVRLGGLAALDEITDALAADEFDKSAVEKVAEEQGAAIEKLKIEVVAALEKLHNTLTPEQRSHLREMLAHN